MAVKHYVDEIPPITGREYEITTNGTKSKITDTTVYEQVGSGFGAADVNSTCILECNYAKEGNVHLLTTDNTLTENIKFYATSAFVRGDTFKFNGVNMTVRTTDGKALGTNFFVAGRMVECFKRGNVLYFANVSNGISDDNTTSVYRIGVENGIMYIEED